MMLHFRGMLNAEEVKLIEKGWTEDPYIQDKKFNRADGKTENTGPE